MLGRKYTEPSDFPFSEYHAIAKNRKKYAEFYDLIHLLGYLNPESNMWKIKWKNNKKGNKRNEEEWKTLHTTTQAREGE